MQRMSRREALRLLLLGSLGLVGCDPATLPLPDSHAQVWGVLIDLSGTAASDREHYVTELTGFIRELARVRRNVVVHVVGFSAYAKPLASGQAEAVATRIEELTPAIRRWPLDSRTDLTSAFTVMSELLRKSPAERKFLWVLSDGIHDPTNRWRTRPPHPVPVPAELPFRALKELGVRIHWDDIDEYQLVGWHQAFEQAGIPTLIHLRGFLETPAARLQQLLRLEETL